MVDPYEQAKEILTRLDKNNDGCITIDELVDGCQSDKQLQKFFMKSLFLC